MAFCENVYNRNLPYAGPPLSIEQKLFVVNSHEISQVIAENFRPLDKHLDKLSQLLQKVATTTEFSNEEIERVIIELNKIIPMSDVLTELMETSEKIVIDILHVLDDENITRKFIKEYIEKRSHYSSLYFIDLFKCILTTGISLKEQTLWVNTTINSIPLQRLQSLCEELVPAMPMSELGRLMGFIKDEVNAQIFVLEMTKHRLMQNESDETCIAHYREFIDQISFAVDFDHPHKPPALILFLKEIERINKLRDHILDELDTYNETNLLLVLWALPEEHLSDYITTCDIDENPYKAAKLLTDLFNLEKHHKPRVNIIENFTSSLDLNELKLLVEALLNTNSCVIPYIFAGLNDEQFEEFAFGAPRAFIDRLLKHLVPSSDLGLQWIVNQLQTGHQKNRLVVICEEVAFDKLSQDADYLDGIFQPVYLTLKKLCDIIRENQNDPDNILTHIQEDIEDTPPFLFALGIHHPELREQIHICSKLLSERQLKAIALSLSEEVLCERLDGLLPHLLMDQVYFVLNSLSMKMGAIFTLHKTEQLRAIYKEISKGYEVFQSKLASNAEKKDLEEGIGELINKIRQVLSPINLKLMKVIRSYIPYLHLFFDVEPLFITMMENCENYSMAIEGILQQLRKQAPVIQSRSTHLAEEIKMETLHALNFTNVAQLNPFGIITTNDLEVLGISFNVQKVEKLKRYLEQKELQSIWAFFNSKKLYSISDLQESCLIEDGEEAYSLKSLATKLGYAS